MACPWSFQYPGYSRGVVAVQPLRTHKRKNSGSLPETIAWNGYLCEDQKPNCVWNGILINQEVEFGHFFLFRRISFTSYFMNVNRFPNQHFSAFCNLISKQIYLWQWFALKIYHAACNYSSYSFVFGVFFIINPHYTQRGNQTTSGVFSNAIDFILNSH